VIRKRHLLSVDLLMNFVFQFWQLIVERLRLLRMGTDQWEASSTLHTFVNVPWEEEEKVDEQKENIQRASGLNQLRRGLSAD
jgi:hypothetical protein